MKLKEPHYSHIDTLIFDLGNVLVDININFTINSFMNLGINGFTKADIHPHNTGIFLDLELGNISNEEFFETLSSSSPQRKPSDMELYYAWNMLILPFDFSRFELLDELRKSYKVHLLSNTNAPHHEYMIQKFDAENPAGRTFKSYFDGCYFSDEMHLRKPDAQIYQSVLDLQKIDARRALFIDDNDSNFTGAIQVGLNTYHLVKPETVFDLFQSNS